MSAKKKFPFWVRVVSVGGGGVVYAVLVVMFFGIWIATLFLQSSNNDKMRYNNCLLRWIYLKQSVTRIDQYQRRGDDEELQDELKYYQELSEEYNREMDQCRFDLPENLPKGLKFTPLLPRRFDPLAP